jgi:hypothetical protein
VLLLELGSAVDELPVAVSVMTVPFAVPEFTLTTSEKVAAVPPAKLTLVQTTFPVPPTAGVVQLHPGDDIDTNVVFAGTASTRVTSSAALGPLLVRTCVKVTLLPAATGSGDAAFETLKSAVELTLAVSVLEMSLVRLSSPPPPTTAKLFTVAGADCETLAVIVIGG